MLLVKASQSYVPKRLQTMTKNMMKVIIRKWIVNVKFFGRRKSIFLVPPLVVTLLMLWPSFWWFARDITRVLLPPSPKMSLDPVTMNRSLDHYIMNTKILIHPNQTCKTYGDGTVVIMVASSPPSSDRRQAVRETWAKFQPTFFVLGRYDEDKFQLDLNDEEAHYFGDLIVFDFQENYQNQTLKTALMMKWTLDECPEAKFLFITLDNVMVNPWTLNQLLAENDDAPLIGYVFNDTNIRKYTYNKWYIPQQLRKEGVVSQYLSGTGYLIKANYTDLILKKAYEVPIVNLADVYFTYLVAHKELGLVLRHDRRLSPYKPWLNIGCVYWGLASAYSYGPIEMMSTWTKLENLVINHDDVPTVCKYFDFRSLNDLVLY